MKGKVNFGGTLVETWEDVSTSLLEPSLMGAPSVGASQGDRRRRFAAPGAQGSSRHKTACSVMGELIHGSPPILGFVQDRKASGALRLADGFRPGNFDDVHERQTARRSRESFAPDSTAHVSSIGL